MDDVNEGSLTSVVFKNLIPFPEGERLQCQYHEKVCQNPHVGYILAMQHPMCFTLGKHADKSDLRDAEKLDSIPVYQTDRGGKVTTHMPGQLVFYMIVPLRSWGITLKKFVYSLEQAVINGLYYWRIRAGRDPCNAGVWVEQEKICALGIRVQSRVSRHGIALNVDNDLDIYKRFTACGLENSGATSLSRLVETPLNREKVLSHFLKEITAAIHKIKV